MNKITLEELKERLDYDPDSGLFTWKEHPNNARCVKAGDIAGTLNNTGYIRIKINSKLYQAHRLAWFYMVGEWPKHQIDHISRVRDDNRFSNLREATHAENLRNRGLDKDNTSGYRGVTWYKREKKWRAQIRVDGKLIHLGYFTTPEEANQVAIKAREQYYGEFS